MAFKIEKALTTMFAAYKLQSQGNLPSVLAEVVTPTIDLNTHSLAAAGCESISMGSGALVAGIVSTFTIPEDWYVVGANCGFVASAVGQSGNVELDFVSPGSPTNHTIAALQWLGIATTSAIGEATFQNTASGFTPFWARKGSAFNGIVSVRGGAAGGTAFFTLLAYRFRAP